MSRSLDTGHAAVADDLWLHLKAARCVLVPTHMNVDGDSLGSVLGLCRALAAAGIQTLPVVSDGRLPDYLRFLARGGELTIYTGQPLPETDLSCLVDLTGLGRLGPLGARADLFAPERTLNIDHHVSNERFGCLNLVDATAAASAEIVHLLLSRWGLPHGEPVATPLLAGLMTDTLSFQTSSMTPRAFAVAGELLAAGAPLEPLVNRLFRAKPLSTARLFGAIASAARLEGGLLWSLVTRSMLAEAAADSSETEGAITYLAGVAEARVFVLVYEEPSGWRASIRSSSDAIDASALAAEFGGGGHRRAAGCSFQGGQAALDRFLARVRERIAETAASQGT